MATAAIRDESRTRQKLVSEILVNAEYVTKPEVFHLWLTVPKPWNRFEFAAHLRRQNVGVVVSDTFSVTGEPAEAVRVCLGGNANRDECRQMLEIIAMRWNIRRRFHDTQPVIAREALGAIMGLR